MIRKSATIRAMRSYNFNHFEASITIEPEMPGIGLFDGDIQQAQEEVNALVNADIARYKGEQEQMERLRSVVGHIRVLCDRDYVPCGDLQELEDHKAALFDLLKIPQALHPLVKIENAELKDEPQAPVKVAAALNDEGYDPFADD